MKLTLINHACCKVETGSLGILFDPWIEGPAFNLGWDLLIPTPLGFDEIMAGVSFIWISHEHPDHFSVPFLTRVASERRDKVTILFQKTRDHRVAGFCRSLGLRVRELDDRVPMDLSDGVQVTCGRSDFYDSWLCLTDGRQTILNLNDCPMRSEQDLRSVRKLAPNPTVLLSQFSYAAWKGGRENAAFRSIAAEQKLETLAVQIRALQPKYTIPFASLVYFSNEENAYLNDAVNTPRDAAVSIRQAGSEPIILYPGGSWQIDGETWDNADALACYDRRYSEIGTLPLRPSGASTSLDTLMAAFRKYQERVFANNSRGLIALLSQLPVLGAFQPVTVKLYDIDAMVSVSVIRGLVELRGDERQPDVTMHSTSLLFIFNNEFGFDTLTVNGRFEASPAGFAKMTRALSVGSLNALGLSISLGLLFNLRVVLILLERLRGVLRRLQQSNKSSIAVEAGEQHWMPARISRGLNYVLRNGYLLYLAARDRRVPILARAVAAAGALYVISPVDLIPDEIPVVGELDDLVVAALGIVLAKRLIPAPLLAELRATAAARFPSSIGFH